MDGGGLGKHVVSFSCVPCCVFAGFGSPRGKKRGLPLGSGSARAGAPCPAEVPLWVLGCWRESEQERERA